jgi:hypothetical protein
MRRLETMNELALARLVEHELARAGGSSGAAGGPADALRLREEDFARMAEAFNQGEARLRLPHAPRA